MQHEISHLYYAPDHPEPQPPAPCCAMSYHYHDNWWYIWEDGRFWFLGDISVRCAFTHYSWCAGCNQTVLLNSGIYPFVVQTLDVSPVLGGTINPAPGHYTYKYGLSVSVTAVPSYGFYFLYLTLNSTVYYQNQIAITMNADHSLNAYFATPALKTKTDGYFYIPNIPLTLLKIEMVFDNSNIVGDQTGGTSPYTMIPVPQYPDGYVNNKDALRVGSCFGATEGTLQWNYMADVNADKCINSKDSVLIGANFGKSGTYTTDLRDVTVLFNTGQEIAPDSNGYVTIPQDATSFTIKRNGNPIGATILFL
ncbi:hypothetical protein HXY33_05350 [Candidatus Bathyarchaeota archaeon]|nr:hypothetical protein [Candidatus Bathyarchaeota archaeon]